MKTLDLHTINRDLEAYFSGALAAEIGLKSSLGPQLDRLENRLGQCSSSDVREPSERQLSAVVKVRGIERILTSIDAHFYLVLAAHFTPLTPSASEGLAAFGSWLGLILLTADRAHLNRLVRAARGKRGSNERTQARESIAQLILRARASLDRALDAYTRQAFQSPSSEQTQQRAEMAGLQ